MSTEVCEYEMGIAYKLSGKYEAAIKAFVRCKEPPDSPEKWVRMADEQIGACEYLLRKSGRPSPR